MAGKGEVHHPHSHQGARRGLGGRSSQVITLVCLGLFILLRLFSPMPVERLRDYSIGEVIDMARSAAPRPALDNPQNVVVVDVDEATIAKYGRWPLPRNVLAQLLDVVNEGGPSAVGFPYVFTGASEGQEVDRRLAGSLKRGPVVLGTAQYRSRPLLEAGNVPLLSVRIDDAHALDSLPYFERLLPIPQLLMGSAAGAGLLSLQLSHDGIPRRLPTVARHHDGLIASLPVEMLRVASGVPAITTAGGSSGMRGIALGPRRIDTDANGMIWFWVDQGDPLRRVSALDILDKRIAPATFRSSYVLIGSTAAGLSSEHVSADGGLLPGLDALAYALAAVVDERTYYYPVTSLPVEILIGVVLALVAFLADRVFTGRRFFVFSFAVIAALWGGAVAVIARSGQILDPGLLSVFALGLFMTLLLNSYRLARQQARTIIAEQEREVSSLREDTARMAVAAANPRLSIALSHELRQPLAAARNYLGAIKRLAGRGPAEGVDRLAQYADEASQQISSMSDIMNELAEIVRGDLTLLREPDLDRVLIDAISATVFSINDPNVHLTTEIPVKPPAVLLNRRQIQLVVSNLARNAIEAPRKHPELALVLRIPAVDAGWVEVSVADNAAGIPDSARARIFSRFESSKVGGSGIGLALCRDIIGAHGGEIWFETGPDTGTTFFFTLRRAD